MKNHALFVHNNFPGQFGFIARRLVDSGFQAAAIATGQAPGQEGVSLVKWAASRGSTHGIFPDATRAEADLLRGRAAADKALALKAKGLDPRIIVGHPGWGEMTYMREIFPAARQILYGEYYYRSTGGDVGFDPEFAPADDHYALKVHPKNAVQMLQYSEADAIVSPTPFQAGRFPSILRPRMRIIHEGVDTRAIRPDPEARLVLPGGRALTRADQVVTLINRRFEPMRGFHIFMRALPRILERLPAAQVVLIGADEAGGYGPPAPDGTTWGKVMLAEVGDRIDRSRVHFLGRVPHPVMLSALSITSAHVYYTYPFVLSWSLLEAMASACPIIASDTAPVRDALTDGVNARLLPFFDVEALAEAVTEAVKKPQGMAALRNAARDDAVRRWDRATQCEPRWASLIGEVLAMGDATAPSARPPAGGG